MRRLATVTAITALAVVLLGTAVPAQAAEYTVTSTGDAPDKAIGTGGCETATPSECTLRAAIQESNASSGTRDKIVFSPAFEGQMSDTIAIGSGFPAITDPVTIDGGTCVTEAGVGGPCAGVNGPTAPDSGLVVDNADEVAIEGLAVSGGLIGIDVIDSSQKFTATNDWVGIRLDGTAGANGTGIFLDPDSDGAHIGPGNVISGNNNEGLDLEGASESAIQGNLFGIKPDGTTQAANGKDIEITSSTAAPGFEAADNVVGGQLSAGEAASAACDGACNVISGASSFGIDLKGNGAAQNEAPAGETRIQGNLIGRNAAGTGVVANFRVGVLVGEADKVLVGGESPEFANRINGGEAGVQAGPSAQDLQIEGNQIGLDAAGTGSELTPTTEGIAVKAEGTTAVHAARIVGNRIAMAGGVAIEVEKSGATATTVADNVIGRGIGGEHLTAGAFGIRLDNSQGTGSTIEGNVVENAHIIGLLIESSNNSVIGNEIIGTEAESGIVIQKFGPQGSSGNIIGGETAADENEISGSGTNAIEIVDGIDLRNEILRNTGSNNGDLFIDLGRDGPGNQVSGPNGGIQAPVIAAATPTAVSGSGALANATIRVFKKATSQNGEIESFLGEVEADGSGSWSLTYESPLPLGTDIGVTQTGIEGTSELAQATTANPPPPAGGGSGGGSGGGGGSPDRTSPQTKITKGPKGKSTSRTATFRFRSSEANSSFQCKLDRGPFKKCRSPKKFKRLKPGKHIFKVRATDAAGNTDPTPAVRKFTVLK
jgi:CSLREA domain-containing protein